MNRVSAAKTTVIAFLLLLPPNTHSSGPQSLWSLLELVPAEWTDWWVGGGLSECVCVCVNEYMTVHKPKVVFMLHLFEFTLYFIDYGQTPE